MNKKYLLLFYMTSIGLGFPAWANPLVNLPQGDLSCSVEVTPRSSPFPAKAVTPGVAERTPPTMKHIEITRVGNLRRDVITWSDGNTTESWKMLNTGFCLVEVAYPSPGIYDVPAGSFLSFALIRKILDLDAASVAWITKDSLLGPAQHNGIPTFHYRRSLTLPSANPMQSPRAVTYESWIDAKTLAPVAFDDGDALYDLTFSASPTEALILPDRFQKRFQYYRRANTVAVHL